MNGNPLLIIISDDAIIIFSGKCLSLCLKFIYIYASVFALDPCAIFIYVCTLQLKSLSVTHTFAKLVV